MKEIKVKIGLEIHLEVLSNSKLFSSSLNSFNHEPNANVDLFDVGFPGVLPIVNKSVVKSAIELALSLKMKVSDILSFDRKNYFYSDLPKGYQITQHFNPLGIDGLIHLDKYGLDKDIHIKELHIEEDTCKQIHEENYTLLNFNRAGVPLIEIVTEPDISSGIEAKSFIEKIRTLAVYLGISNGKMEEGSLRCDVNISISKDNEPADYKVEIKNLNSINNVEKAIDYEIKRQINLLEKGEKIAQETRRFDEAKQETVFMRNKEDIDYCYMVEPNIVPISLKGKFIKDIISSLPTPIEEVQEKLKESGISEEYIDILFADYGLFDYFNNLILTGAVPKNAAKWVVVEVRSILNRNNISIKDFNVSYEHLGQLIKMEQDKKISHTQAKAIFEVMVDTNKEPDLIVKELNICLNIDKDYLLSIINKLLDQNPNLVIDYKNGKDKILGFFVGQIMKITHGNANPSLVNELLLKEINRR